MNSKLLQYAIELAEIRNFSRVSEKLNISQPALSKQILHLEKDLGVKLFDRNCIPLRLTPAGEHFIKEAKELLYQEDQLRRSLEHYRSEEWGRLTIGLSPFRSMYLIPPIAKKVRERFPGVEISVCDTNSEHIRKDIADGRLDFAIVNLPVDDSVLEYIPLELDVLVLAVPKEMLYMIPQLPDTAPSEINFKDCAKLPFVVAEPSKEMRFLFDHLCKTSNIQPRIAMEVVGLTSAWAMARAGIGATILPLQFVDSDSFDKNVKLFSIKDNTFTRQPAIVTRRGQYLPAYAKYAISLLTGTTE